MLGYFFTVMIIISTVFALMKGNIPQTAQAAISGGADAVKVAIGLAGAVCFWCGIMRVAEHAGITGFLSKILSPFIRKLLPSLPKNSEGEKAACMNISANILGLGNAATPYGLKAMEYMSVNSPKNGVATKDMVIFTVLNTASIQIIPTTIAAIRAASGAKAPFDILPPVWVTSIGTAIFGIILAFIVTSFTLKDKSIKSYSLKRKSVCRNMNRKLEG